MKFILKSATLLASLTPLTTIAPVYPIRICCFELLDGYGYPQYFEDVDIPVLIFNPIEGYHLDVDQNFVPKKEEHSLSTITIHNDGSNSQIRNIRICYSMLLPYDYGTEMMLDFVLYSNDGEVVQSNSIHVKKSKIHVVFAKANLNKRVEYKGYAWSIKDRKVVDGESFDFSKSRFNCSIEKDRSLDLSDVLLYYENGYTLTGRHDTAYMYVYDPNNYYVNFVHDDDGITVPIRFEQDGNNITFYTRSLYYDPKTLEMSPTFIQGYTPTDKFYVKSGRESCIDNEFNFIRLDQFNLSREYFFLDALNYIEPSSNYTGLCGNSSYCISGGIKE